jgi:hypothetical protein
MWVTCLVLHLLGVYPLTRLVLANRRTSLTHAVGWVIAAWAGWLVAILLNRTDGPNVAASDYLAVCLTSCAGVAVLGARRPGVAAWDFVVFGLLAVQLLPLAEGFGELRLTTTRLAFLMAVVAVIGFNYGPTRNGSAAAVLTVGCWVVAWTITVADHTPASEAAKTFGLFAVLLSPWLALAAHLVGRRPLDALERTWLAFRDRFGLTWSLRIRDQFNRAAANAGWQWTLGWSGRISEPGRAGGDPPAEAVALLEALLKRFGAQDG